MAINNTYGDDPNKDVLKKFSPVINPGNIDDVDFTKFFIFLSQTQGDPRKAFIMGKPANLDDLINKKDDKK